MSTIQKYFQVIGEMSSKKIPYTSMAIAAYENNTSRLALLYLNKIVHSVTVYFINVNEQVNDKILTRIYVVDEQKYTQCD